MKRSESFKRQDPDSRAAARQVGDFFQAPGRSVNETVVEESAGGGGNRVDRDNAETCTQNSTAVSFLTVLKDTKLMSTEGNKGMGEEWGGEAGMNCLSWSHTLEDHPVVQRHNYLYTQYE